MRKYQMPVTSSKTTTPVEVSTVCMSSGVLPARIDQRKPSITPTIATGAWEFYTPLAGWSIFDNLQGLTWRFNGTSWNFTRIASTAAFAAGTTVAVPFPVTYTGTLFPTIVVTAFGANPTSAGAIWITSTGSSGAWTGFTINAASSNSLTFNYVVEG